VRKCRACGNKLGEGKARCAGKNGCGAWNFGEADTSIPGDDGSVLYEDIDEKSVERLSTGLLDHCLGGGCVRSDVILIGGLPGGGKSTAMLQTAEKFCEHGTVLYISAEEDIRTIKIRGKRLRINTRGNLRFLPALSGVANIGAMLAIRKPNFIIIDSIDSLSGRNDDMEIEILSALKKFCVELNSPALVVSRINKAGDYAGLMDKQHEVDVLLTMEATDYRVEGNDEPLRKIQTLKNRSGRAFTESFFEMTPDGLVLTLSPEQDASEQNGSEGDDGPVSESEQDSVSEESVSA
jgi:DNA repair protein RadA/Sms